MEKDLPGRVAHQSGIEAQPHNLVRYPESLTHGAQRALQRLGVEVKTGTRVTAIDANWIVVDNTRIATSTVIWTAGVQASAAGTWLEAEGDQAGRVKVQADLPLPDFPEIFVIGDTASVMQDGQVLPGIAPVAMQEGRYVASVIRRASRWPAVPFRYREKGNLATVGRAYAIVDLALLRLLRLDCLAGYPYLLFDWL
jgi:NADH dehydrogenase